MKRIIDHRKLFGVTQTTDLAQLKITYRNLIKEWHPDKFLEGDIRKEQSELKSKSIIEAYHFLVSISPETHTLNSEEYNQITSSSIIDDFVYKGQTLKITFQDQSTYEYFGVPKNIYTKLINSSTQSRFARRHIYNSFTYRNIRKQTTV